MDDDGMVSSCQVHGLQGIVMASLNRALVVSRAPLELELVIVIFIQCYS